MGDFYLTLADKNIYKNLPLSKKIVSSQNEITLANFTTGYMPTNNIRYYKTVKKTMYLCEFCNFDN